MREVKYWKCCWCRDYSGNSNNIQIGSAVIRCPVRLCAHVRCSDCLLTRRKLDSSGLTPPQNSFLPDSTWNVWSTSAERYRALRGGSSETGGGSRSGDEGGHNQKSDVVLESTINSTTNATFLQDGQISDSVELNPGLIPQDTDASKTQEGKPKNFDSDPHNLNMVDTTNKSAKSPGAAERDFKGNGIFSRKRTPSESQGPLNSQSPLDVPTFSECALDLLIKDPTSYSEDITLLEHRLLQLGQNTFENIEKDDEIGRYVLPLRKLDYGTEPSTPFSTTSDQQLRINSYIQLQASISIETLSSIIKGTQLLQNEGFCNSSTYNVIVQDKNRPQVLNVRPISMPSLSLLLELLREMQEFIQQEDNQQRDLVLEDVAEILLHIVVSLGLGIPQTVLAEDKHNLERQQDICHLLSSILSVAHVVLLSFVRSHLDNSGCTLVGLSSEGLHIECPGGVLVLAARRLECLNGLLKQPVWALSFVSNWMLSIVRCDGFYLSSSIDDLAELWGPLRLNRTEE
ncbi:hypothetical protein EAE96_009891 [Botrytis aclada]|nr:hypothetical protein EAE96_009891 [Botrytis aclada]